MKHGSGPGYGRERLRAMLPDYRRDRVYFYLASDDRPEKQLAGCCARYEAEVPRGNVYSLKQDRHALYNGDITSWENAILAFGYQGYVRDDGIVVLFGDILVSAAYTPAMVARRIVETHRQCGGSSITQTGENLYGRRGYAVSCYKGLEIVLDVAPVEQEILSYMYSQNVKETLARNPGAFVGTWADTDKGGHYLDVSQWVQTREDAVRLGREAGQLAVFDLEHGEAITL
jgi:hypothetical protein